MQNRILFNDYYIDIECQKGDQSTLSVVNTIPYVHKNRINTRFRTTIKNIDTVLELFRGVDAFSIEKTPKRIQELFNKEMRRRNNTKTLLELGPNRPSGRLYKHQQLGVELSEENDKYAFFYDTRTGKTLMSLQIIANDIAKNPDNKWLILCPLFLIENAWLEDLAKFFPSIKAVSLHDKTKAKRLKRFNQEANVYIQNIESFCSYEQYVRQLNVVGCFVDESSTMKSNSAKFSKAAVKYAYDLQRFYLLSGTPAPNGEWEYYKQLQAVDYYSVHSSYSQFKKYFFDNVSFNPQFERLEAKSERKEELISLIEGLSLYVDKEDVLNTPGRSFKEYEIIMPDNVSEVYHKFRREMYMETKDAMITAQSAAAKTNKLNQISSGFIIDTDNATTVTLSNYRIEALKELISANVGSKQCIIWANYHHEFDRIKELLGDNCLMVYGKVNITEKNKNIKAFKEGKAQFLVANPASADKGLTLTNAHLCIYYSLNHSYELWKQSIERIYGDISKQKHSCTYYILIAKGTIDKTIYNTVKTKGVLSKNILDHLKGGGCV